MEEGRCKTTGGPWVTFLLPVFNGMPHLREAVDSIMSQENPDWALTIIDDASTDDSWTFLQSLDDARVKIYQNATNAGLYATLSTCIEQVDTPWTCLVFQDDRLRSDFTLLLRRITQEHPEVASIWCAINVIEATGRTTSRGIDSGRTELIWPGACTWRSILLRGTVWTISGSLTQTRILREYRFRSDLPHLGDFEFLLRALRHETFLYHERPLVDIREHEGQASSRNLASLQDIHEKIRVISEQINTHGADAGYGFRLRLTLSTSRNIVMRTLGFIRRRKYFRAIQCINLLPRMAASCSGWTAIRSNAR